MSEINWPWYYRGCVLRQLVEKLRIEEESRFHIIFINFRMDYFDFFMISSSIKAFCKRNPKQICRRYENTVDT